MGCIFTLVMAFFAVQKLFNFVKFHLFNIGLITYDSAILFRQIFLVPIN